jgi:class 3 adenylate cyclase
MLVVAEEISFTGSSRNCCICFIEIVDSIKITQDITDAGKIAKYYSIFINTMAALARDFDATVIKNTGDSLIYYFPKTADSSNNMCF